MASASKTRIEKTKPPKALLNDEAVARRKANAELCELGHTFHQSIPLAQIDDILERYNFSPLEPAIYCGRDGHIHEQVSARSWLSLSWHKMEVSGRYEIVAYVN